MYGEITWARIFSKRRHSVDLRKRKCTDLLSFVVSLLKSRIRKRCKTLSKAISRILSKMCRSSNPPADRSSILAFPHAAACVPRMRLAAAAAAGLALLHRALHRRRRRLVVSRRVRGATRHVRHQRVRADTEGRLRVCFTLHTRRLCTGSPGTRCCPHTLSTEY